MLDTDTKLRIDTARDILVGKVPDPKSQVEQISIAPIYKFMHDMDAEAEALGGKRNIEILSPPMRCEVVYVQPTGDGDADINFTLFHSIVAKHTDPLSRRFAESLSAWSERAGSTDAR